MSTYSLGFIGLGVMGYPMVLNLVKKVNLTDKLHVYDISSQILAKLEAESPDKVDVCTSSREVTEKSNIILTMVPEGSHVRAVYLNKEHGILAADSIDGKLLIDCSTIDTSTSLAVADAVSEKSKSAAMYDAPVSGGSLGAAAGTLTFMVGCTESDPHFPTIKELLATMGKSIFPCGGFSLGLTAKLCNNYCSGLVAIATAEAMDIGIKSGMDPRVLASIFSTSTAQSTINDKWNPVPGICPDAPSSKDYQGGFKVQLMKKDFQLAVDTAARVGSNVHLASSGLEVYQGASEDENCRDRDSRVVFRYLGGDEDWFDRFSPSKP
ncbi:hypothetical protein N7474_009916 [Penicillium riverlandense]|uniref:uncharacterized protein n=1 Tax=Penicillium riverlandense TaxID=1903569 RepID=UPI0025495902|nr:uncharacterized protein N7474_009916 [Penicillium riverlandense]KAJ5808647.1 hypothetical protein N7474_009916 [Penicillium riverlandense]